MNASKKSLDLSELLAELDLLNAKLDAVLGELERGGAYTDRAAIIAALAELLEMRGTVIDAIVAWCATANGTRTRASEHMQWQDALERLRTRDRCRLERLGAVVERAGEQLRQRIAQQSLFIYQRGAL